jgi:hypothetical protein
MATPGTQRYGQHRDLRDTGNTNNSEILATPRTQRYWQHRELRDTGNTGNSEILATPRTQRYWQHWAHKTQDEDKQNTQKQH